MILEVLLEKERTYTCWNFTKLINTFFSIFSFPRPPTTSVRSATLSSQQSRTISSCIQYGTWWWHWVFYVYCQNGKFSRQNASKRPRFISWTPTTRSIRAQLWHLDPKLNDCKLFRAWTESTRGKKTLKARRGWMRDESGKRTEIPQERKFNGTVIFPALIRLNLKGAETSQSNCSNFDFVSEWRVLWLSWGFWCRIKNLESWFFFIVVSGNRNF